MTRMLLCAALLFASAAALAFQAPQPARSTRDGVYTREQAERGHLAFDEHCTECHVSTMWGMDWDRKTVGDIYSFMSENMPEPRPGALAAGDYRDIIAFLLASNGLPAGQAELPTSAQELARIKMERSR